MFEDLLKTAGQLNGMKVPVSLGGPDVDGYIDKQYPTTDCAFIFKVHGDDWRDKVSDEAVHCAFCGHVRRQQAMVHP